MMYGAGELKDDISNEFRKSIETLLKRFQTGIYCFDVVQKR